MCGEMHDQIDVEVQCTFVYPRCSWDFVSSTRKADMEAGRQSSSAPEGGHGGRGGAWRDFGGDRSLLTLFGSTNPHGWQCSPVFLPPLDSLTWPLVCHPQAPPPPPPSCVCVCVYHTLGLVKRDKANNITLLLLGKPLMYFGEKKTSVRCMPE